MKNFKLYGYIGRKAVLITDSKLPSAAATYDETCQIQANQQVSFSCSIAKYVSPNKLNLFYDLFYPEARLKLELFDYDEELEYSFDLIVTSCSPAFYHDNQIVKINANDYASIRFAKKGSNLSLEQTGNIYQLATSILDNTHLNNDYNGTYENRFKIKNVKLNTIDNTIYDTPDANAYKTDTQIIFQSLTSNTFTSIFEYTIDAQTPIGNYNCMFRLPKEVTTFDYSIKQIVVDDLEQETETTIITSTSITNNSQFISVPLEIVYGEKSLIFTFNFVAATQRIFPLLEFGLYKQIRTTAQSKWTIDPECLNDFVNQDTSESYYTKNTISLSGSNLYNALVELATAFNAELKFDYENRVISFENKNLRTYKGVKLDPNYNINEFSRTTTNNDLVTVLDVYGQNNNDNQVYLIDKIPDVLKNYFIECVNNDFEDFDVYTDGAYKAIASQLTSDPEVLQYAEILDHVPNFENRIYDIDYFYNKGDLSEESYQHFKELINDELRKANIKINIYSERYNTLITKLYEYIALLTNYSIYLTTNEREYNKLNYEKTELEDKINSGELSPALLKTYQTQVQGYKNSINTNVENRTQFLNSIYELLGITNNNNYTGSTESLYYAIRELYGYSSPTMNGFSDKINDIQQQINDKKAELAEKKQLLADIEQQKESAPDYQSLVNLTAQEAGYWSDIRTLYHMLGTTRELIDEYTPLYANITQQLEEQRAYMRTLNEDIAFVLNYDGTETPDPRLTMYNELLTNNVELLKSKISQIYNRYVDEEFDFEDPEDSIEIFMEQDPSQNDITWMGHYCDIYEDVISPSSTFNMTKWDDLMNIVYQNTDNAINNLSAQISRYEPIVKEDVYTGYLFWQLLFYQNLLDAYEKSDQKQTTGLYDYLYNNDSGVCVIKEKNDILAEIYNDYEEFLIEGYYEDDSSLDSWELLQQAWIVLNRVTYPKITYNIGIIDLSVLENYKYLKVAIGDKIKISEELYLKYNPEYQDYIEISEIQYDLRHPENTKLVIDKQEQDNRLIQQLFLNMIKN